MTNHNPASALPFRGVPVTGRESSDHSIHSTPPAPYNRPTDRTATRGGGEAGSQSAADPSPHRSLKDFLVGFLLSLAVIGGMPLTIMAVWEMVR